MSLEQILNDTTLSDYNMLCRYWAKNPPVHLSVKWALLGSSSDGAGSTATAAAAPATGGGAKPWETERVEDLFMRWSAAGGGVR